MRASSIVMLFAAILVLAAPCFAERVIVTDASSGGTSPWTSYSSSGSTGYITGGGPAVDEGVGFLTDHFGAYYMEKAVGYNNVSSAWLGLKSHAGVTIDGSIKLSQITKLTYKTYVSKVSQWTDGITPRYPRQPIQMVIAITWDGVNRRVLMHRPWGLTGAELEEFPTYCGMWQEWDAMACSNSTPDDQWWIVWQETAVPNWSSITTMWPNAALVPTSTGWNPDGATRTAYEWKTDVWDGSNGDPRCTGSGAAINLAVGARKTITNIFNENNGYAWWRESNGFKGYVDDVTIGIDIGTPGSPDVKEITYDFEPASTPQIVATNIKSCRDAIVYTNRINQKFRFKVCGIVLADPAPTSDEFSLDDGSGTPIRVQASGHGVAVGQFWSAVGTVTKDIWHADSYPRILLSSSADCFQLD